MRTILLLCVSMLYLNNGAYAGERIEMAGDNLPAEWVESGTICGFGKSRTESVINLNGLLRQPTIQLEREVNPVTGTENKGMFLKAPYRVIGPMVYEKKSWMLTYRHVTCQMVSGKKPSRQDSSTVGTGLGRLVCQRTDGARDVILSEKRESIRFVDSFGEVRECSQVPGGTSDRVFSCADKKRPNSQALFINLDKDARKISVSVYHHRNNTFTESYKAQCFSNTK